MPGRWELFDHTADVGLLAHGGDEAEALAAAGAGLFDLMIDRDAVRESESVRVEVTGVDGPDLLVGWLNELLYIFEVKGLAIRRVEVALTEDGRRLVAAAHGEPYDSARHGVRLGVKAATRHLAALDPDLAGPPGSWRARVILDV